MEPLNMKMLVEKLNVISRMLAHDEFKTPQPVFQIVLNFNCANPKEAFIAEFKYIDIKDGYVFKTQPCGYGSTPEEAMIDYYNQIIGKTLVYRAMKDYRKEYKVE